MRVTNSMLVSNYLGDLNTNMNKLSKLQTQMSNGRKYASISDDPVSAIYSMQAQFRLDRLDRYQKSVEMAQSWLTQAETSVMEINDLYKNAYEQVIYASTNVKTDDDRSRMAEYIKALRDQLLQTLNTSFGNKYIFAGYNTTGAYPPPDNVLETPFKVDDVTGHILLNGFDLTAFDASTAVPGYDPNYDTTIAAGAPGFDQAKYDAAMIVEVAADTAAITAGFTLGVGDPGYDAFVANYKNQVGEYNKLNGEMLEFWVGNGQLMNAQINGVQLVGTGEDNLYSMLDNIYKIMSDTSLPLENMVTKIQEFIPKLQDKQGNLLSVAAELGGRANRLEMLADRYGQDYLNYTQMKSDAQDADEAELIMMYKMAESVYKAALSTGSYIIQQTLMDFLR